MTPSQQAEQEGIDVERGKANVAAILRANGADRTSEPPNPASVTAAGGGNATQNTVGGAQPRRKTRSDAGKSHAKPSGKLTAAQWQRHAELLTDLNRAQVCLDDAMNALQAFERENTAE